jgi:hypothetical protein
MWEYKEVYISEGQSMAEVLNKHGKCGWELVAIRVFGEFDELCILKRPIGICPS